MSDCNLKPIHLVRGEDALIELVRRHYTDGTDNLVTTDCTGWTIEAKVVYKQSLDIPIAVSFVDAENGTAELDFTEEDVDLITPNKGCKLVVTWIDESGRKKRTRLLVEVCDG